MADFFHTSVDYLIGRTDESVDQDSHSVLCQEEAKLIADYRELSIREKESILLVIENYRR